MPVDLRIRLKLSLMRAVWLLTLVPSKPCFCPMCGVEATRINDMIHCVYGHSCVMGPPIEVCMSGHVVRRTDAR